MKSIAWAIEAEGVVSGMRQTSHTWAQCLHLEMLAVAMKDAASRPYRGVSDATITAARAWIYGDGDGAVTFADCCARAQRSPYTVRRVAYYAMEPEARAEVRARYGYHHPMHAPVWADLPPWVRGRFLSRSRCRAEAASWDTITEAEVQP